MKVSSGQWSKGQGLGLVVVAQRKCTGISELTFVLSDSLPKRPNFEPLGLHQPHPKTEEAHGGPEAPQGVEVGGGALVGASQSTSGRTPLRAESRTKDQVDGPLGP